MKDRNQYTFVTGRETKDSSTILRVIMAEPDIAKAPTEVLVAIANLCLITISSRIGESETERLITSTLRA